MGVPKFFRWLSERYPAISQLIAENRIPEFDCLYLDMNGIIHNCTHKDSDSPTFRMTEDKMFIAIFNYIEHLFGKIKPKQLFFMAIDGVAPRAKMNQQRARRFRTALDAEMAREKAIKEGVEMPKEEPFDSNCITPGTEFMARLTQHLKYFINKKVSEDVDWQGVEVVLSGHEVPGEGEHKIMEYIRQAKSQPGYDPNRRHCLYGLDADLIMLGLLSHDPHFCLLREEVTFGRQNQKKHKELEHQNFYLMHLCIVREYLELEFQQLQLPGALDFPFDLERIIDDFILMAFFVGNDFLPNLPHLHINEGALALMFGVYKAVIPKAKGYINEGGVINLERLGLLLDELSNVEFRFFEAENADANWLKAKQMGSDDAAQSSKKKGQLTISSEQRKIFRTVKKYVNNKPVNKAPQPLDLPSSLPARDRKFVEDLAGDLHLEWKTVQNSEGERHLQISFPPMNLEEDSEDEEQDAEGQDALFRVMRRYENAKIVDLTSEQAQAQAAQKYNQKFQDWKQNHYTSKLGWGLENEEELRKLTENYVQGLQWVLFYYYRGVASWPWFYRYHYAPMISDVKKGLGANMDFKLGQPFHPYEQLMGVLPDRSKKIVPSAYHDLMTDPKSPIIDFYPREFELDMNGKKMDWEAVVKIPFIDETRLLAAMSTRDHLLTDAERARNEFGVSLKFTYAPDVDFVYPSSLPGIFPDLSHSHCVENIFELPTMDGLEVYVGLMDGVQLGAAALAGFPSLKTLPFTGTLGFHGVSVFQQESRNESMVITLSDSDIRAKVSEAQKKLGKSVHIGYPFLQEAKVVRVSDELFDYVLPNHESAQVIPIAHDPHNIAQWKKTAERIENVYSKRLGMIIGPVESLVHVEMLKGLKKTNEGATVKEYAEILGLEHDYAAQTVVDEVVSEDQRFLEKAAIPFAEEFPEGSRAFFLGEYNYGRPLEVIATRGETADIWVSTVKGRESEFGREIATKAERNSPYIPSYAVAKRLNLNPLVLSKLTSSFSVNSSSLRLNLGLNLKFEAKKLKVLGYSRRGETGWEYSPKAIDLIQQYMIRFPEFIAGVIRNPKGDTFEDTDFYPENIAREKMKEIGAWLKSIESKSFERVPLDAQQLDSDVVKEIEEAADRAVKEAPPGEAKKIKGVPRSALLKPSDAEHRLGAQKFRLGDRVVYVQDSGKVPIAQRGTVIGVTRTSRTTFLDVVFDTSFMSGTSLGDRCSPFRGSTVPVTSVLNITDKQAISWSKAATAHRPAPSSQPLTLQGGYGAPIGPNGAGQLIPAAAPQPLRGSFRAAVSSPQGGVRGNGTSSRGRGRGHVQNGHLQSGGQSQQLPVGQTAAFSTSNSPSGRGQQSGPSNRGVGAGNAGLGYRGGNAFQTRQEPNRSGYVVTDQSDPSAGVLKHNPNFRPQSYSNVPPPASLNGPQQGRGRGGGRGRGASGHALRGRGASRARDT